MNKKQLFFLILFLGNSLMSLAQEKSGQAAIDSLMSILPSIKVDTVKINTLVLIAEQYKDIDPNLGITYGNKALAFSKKIDWDSGLAKSLLVIGENSFILGDKKTAEKYYTESSLYAKDKLNICKLYITLGSFNYENGDYKKALKYLFDALKISEEIKAEKVIARASNIIGVVYLGISDYKKALFYIKKALIINTRLKRNLQISKGLQLIASIYKTEGKYPLALEYFSRSEKLCKELNIKEGLAYIYFEKAQVFLFQEKHKEALNYVQKGEQLALELNSFRHVVGGKRTKAQIYMSMFYKDSLNPKNRLLLNQVEKLLIEVNKDFITLNDKKSELSTYELFSQLYAYQKEYKKAYYNNLKYIALNDSIFNQESKETIKNLEDQRTIDLKNKEIEINKITLESKEKQKWFYIIGIGFLSILGGLFFYQSRKRKKTNERLQFLNSELELANKSKVKFLSILNHDLRSPVYNFIHFMQLQKESPELLDTDTKKNIETKTINSAENLLASMEDLLLWSKGQMDNFKPQPQVIAVNSLFEDTKKHFESEEKVTIEFENSDNIYINTDENFLKTIIRNLTGNAIKATKNSEKAKITWKAWKDNDTTYLSITDSGSGMSQEKFKALYDENEVVGIKSGLGLHLIRDLAKAINCKIVLESNNAIGTSFTLELT